MVFFFNSLKSLKKKQLCKFAKFNEVTRTKSEYPLKILFLVTINKAWFYLEKFIENKKQQSMYFSYIEIEYD